MSNTQADAVVQNERGIRAFLDGTLTGDKARVLSGLDPDVVLALPRPTMSAKTIRGAQNLADFMVDLFNASYSEAHATYGVMVVSESGGAVEWRLQAKLRAGGPYDQFYCWVFVCRNGRITEIHEYIDTLYGMKANGPAGAQAIEIHAA